jgi:hypothetical protein
MPQSKKKTLAVWHTKPLTRSASKPMGKILGAGKILPKMSASKKQFSEILRSQRRRRRKNKKSKDAGAESSFLF